MNEISKKMEKVDKQDLMSKVKKDTAKRTTFKLFRFANDALNNLSSTHNLKHKEIFNVGCKNEKILEIVITLASNENEGDKNNEVFQRTLLINNSSLNILKKVSKEKNIKRDLLASYLIFTVNSLLEDSEKEDRKNFKKGEEFISKVGLYLEEQESILEKEIGKDHPVVHAFGNVIVTCMNLSTAISDHLYNNKPFDKDFF
jgi:hypothetical protein